MFFSRNKWDSVLFRCPMIMVISRFWSHSQYWLICSSILWRLPQSKHVKKKNIQGEWSCCNHLCHLIWVNVRDKIRLGSRIFTDPIVVDTISMWLCLKICYHQFQWVIILIWKNGQIAHFQPIKPWLFSSANRQSRISWLTPGTRWFRAWSKASPKFPAMISRCWAPQVSGPGSLGKTHCWMSFLLWETQKKSLAF